MAMSLNINAGIVVQIISIKLRWLPAGVMLAEVARCHSLIKRNVQALRRKSSLWAAQPCAKPGSFAEELARAGDSGHRPGVARG
jgi:hypothetical protein